MIFFFDFRDLHENTLLVGTKDVIDKYLNVIMNL